MKKSGGASIKFLVHVLLYISLPDVPLSIYLATAGRETQTVPFRESCSMND